LQLVLRSAAAVALFLEYEAVLTRPEHLAKAGITVAEAEIVLDVLAAVVESSISCGAQGWDADDDIVLEAANGRAEAIVTFNARDFANVTDEFGLALLTPNAILRRM
jgi:PIN domain-containing protein